MKPEDIGRIHFIGVGGSGMSALARFAILRGMDVTGSDLQRGDVVDGLVSLGLTFQKGHAPSLVKSAKLVVASSAVPLANEEIVWAREHGVTVWKRHEFLPWLTRGNQVIAVAGSHGKTTVTAMLADALLRCGLDVSAIIGGFITSWGANARVGKSNFMVLEADEYDRTFLALNPWLAVVTNVEMDHPDCYRDQEDLVAAFSSFMASSKHLVANSDHPGVAAALRGANANDTVTYGWNEHAQWRILEVRQRTDSTLFKFIDKSSRVHDACVTLFGQHSAENALAVIAAANVIGVQAGQVIEAVAHFQGVERRFSISGPFGGVYLIDDYAHHPTQIRSAVDAARQRFPGGRIVMLMQPHTFSRLALWFDEFAASLREADKAFVLPVYGAREEGDSISHARALAEAAGAKLLSPVPANALPYLLADLRSGDVVLNLGAGDGRLLSVALAKALCSDRGDSGGAIL